MYKFNYTRVKNKFNYVKTVSLHLFFIRLQKMSGRFDRTNFVFGIETLFEIIIYTLKNHYEDKSFSKKLISEVCI